MEYPPFSMIVPSLNEGDWLVRTVQSIRESTPADTEIIHVDDASCPPEPSLAEWDVRTFRLPQRMGAARARAYGMLQARPSSRALITVDAHCRYGAGDATAALVEEKERFKTLGGLSMGYQPSAWEVGCHLEPDKLVRLAALVVEHDCIGYMGPCGQGTATVTWIEGLLKVIWKGRVDAVPYVKTAAANGGQYAFSRGAYERIGGYPQLPGYFSCEEEALALLACACDVPIICATELSPWHVYRGQGTDVIPRPYDTSPDRELDNLAAVYRIAFSDKVWAERWRNVLATAKSVNGGHGVPEYCLQAVETPEFARYVEIIQENFKRRDDDLLLELETRRLVDSKRVAVPK